jgi:hypothetical protein
MLIKSIEYNSIAMFSQKTDIPAGFELLFLSRMQCPLRHATRAYRTDKLCRYYVVHFYGTTCYISVAYV